MRQGSHKQKKGSFQAESPSLGEGRGLEVAYLTSAGQEIPDWLVKITLPGKAETVIRLGIKS